MDKYQYLVFENNPKLSSLPKTILITNKEDNLRGMSYYFKRVLDDHKVENRLLDVGADGHIGIIFKAYTDENQKVLDDIQKYFEI